MQSLERHIAALESVEPPPYRWVWRDLGESETAGKSRAGIVPGDNVIGFSWKEHHALA